MGGSKLTLLADIFNLFDQQATTDYDNYTESSFAAANPDFGLPFEYQTPRRIRLGVRLTW
jgi:outer membrane receptor protein involved in Fe transport